MMSLGGLWLGQRNTNSGYDITEHPSYRLSLCSSSKSPPSPSSPLNTFYSLQNALSVFVLLSLPPLSLSFSFPLSCSLAFCLFLTLSFYLLFSFSLYVTVPFSLFIHSLFIHPSISFVLSPSFCPTFFSFSLS